MALSYNDVHAIASNINEKIKGNHIAGITLINSHDVVFTFSFYRKEKMIISLNHNYPLVGMIDKEISFPTIMNKLCEELRNKIKDTIVLEVKSINDDRIIEFTFQKTDEFYQKQIIYLVVELIPHHPNLLILDEEKHILFANHYSSLTDKRIVIKNMVYELPEKGEFKEKAANLVEFYAFLEKYLSDSMDKRLKEKYSKLIDTIKRKIKTANNKTVVLNKEIKEAETKLVYQEYGSTLLTLKDDKESLEEYIKENNIPIDSTKSYVDNANLFFKKYKKAKETILKDKEQLEINNVLISKLNNDLSSLKDADESIYLLLSNEYLKTPIKKQEINALSPFYVVIDNTKIAFGRNAVQNDILTFKRAHNENLFFHLKDYSGSHVVILKTNPNDNDKENAAMLCLALANKEAGEIQTAKIADLKKGQFVGQVIFSRYSVVRINFVNNKVKVALNNVKRLNL